MAALLLDTAIKVGGKVSTGVISTVGSKVSTGVISTIGNIGEAIFGGEIDYAKALPKLFYNYSDQGVQSNQIDLYLASDGRFIGNSNNAWQYVVNSGIAQQILKLEKSNNFAKTDKWQYIKHMIEPPIPPSGSRRGYKGNVNVNGVSYDKNAAPHSETVQNRNFLSNIQNSNPNPSNNSLLYVIGGILALMFWS